jgi:1-acyl-sn-glycerol-3-phosphate acyltransferase
MIILRLIINYIYWVGIFFLFILFSLISVQFAFLPKGGRKIVYSLAGRALRILFFVTFLRARVKKLALLPRKKNALFICNRPCFHAPLYLIAYFPRRFRYVVDEALLRFLFIGTVFRTLGVIPYPKETSGKQAAWVFAGQLFSALKGGEDVLVLYRSVKGESRKRAQRRERLVDIARLCGAEIVPIRITTKGEGNGKNRHIFLMGEIEVEVKEPIQVKDRDNAQVISQISAIFENP